MTTKRIEKCSVENCTKKVQTKTIRGFDGSRVLIPKLQLNMPKTWPERNEMYDDYDQFWNSSSSNDEDDPLDSIVRRFDRFIRRKRVW